MKENKILQHAHSMASSINCLLENNHPLQAAMLTYAAIDQMAWLAIESDRSCNRDFKNWVDRYVLPNCDLPCTADELWAARNGLLHMGTAESRDHKQGSVDNKIYYTSGSAVCTRNDSDDTIFLAVEHLGQAYLAGVMWFVGELKQDHKRLQIALDKMQKVLKLKDMRPDSTA